MLLGNFLKLKSQKLLLKVAVLSLLKKTQTNYTQKKVLDLRKH